MRALLPLLALCLAAGACGPRPDPGAAAGDRVVLGEVVSVDLAPMAYDGDAVIRVRAGAETVRVLVAARMNLCAATGLDLVGALQPGDAVEVVGAVMDDAAVRPCESEGHRIARQGATVREVEGTFAYGFETSALLPCGETDTYWWVESGRSGMLEAYQEMAGPPQGRGLGPYVHVRLLAEVSPEGTYGPLQNHPREIRVREVIEMERVKGDPEMWPQAECGG